jgi:hypothetical protein
MNEPTPCPFVNLLVNSKRIPTKNITVRDLVSGIRNVGVFDETMILFIEYGIIKPSLKVVNPISSIISSIQDIQVLEHDISISRLDKYQGDSISFDEEHFQRLKNKSTNRTHITLQNIADYRKELIITARNNNPNFKFGTSEMLISCGEDAFLQTLFSDETGNIRIDWLDIFFRTKKIPSKKDKYKHRKVSLVEWTPAFLTQVKNLYDY